MYHYSYPNLLVLKLGNKMLAFALPVVLCVACLFLTADATQCSKDIPADVEVDCTTALMDCPHYSSRQTQGMEIGPIENPAPK